MFPFSRCFLYWTSLINNWLCPIIFIIVEITLGSELTRFWTNGNRERERERERRYTVDVIVFFSCFSLVSYIFRIKVFLIVFGLVVCLFFFCFCTCTVCTYKLGTRVMNSQIFRCIKYMRYMFHFLIFHSTLPSKSYLWI